MAKHTIGEEWRPVVGYEGVYEVSNTGLVRRVHSHRKTFPAFSIMKMRPNVNGYPSIGLRKHGQSKMHRVHCLVLAAFVGPRPSGFHCNHKNGIKTDNRLDNVEWVTPEYNYKHSDVVLNKVQRGSCHHNAKLCEADVVRMRTMFSSGTRIRDIAKEYRLNKTTVSDAVNGRTWKALSAALASRLARARKEGGGG
jgi:hypothetical protein